MLNTCRKLARGAQQHLMMAMMTTRMRHGERQGLMPAQLQKL
jgi:hypothetical protein